jgi:hypothetical protein
MIEKEINLKNLEVNTSKYLKELGNKVKLLTGQEIHNLVKAIRKIETIESDFQESRNKLIVAYAKKGLKIEPGMPIEIDNKEEFNKKINELIEAQENIKVYLPEIYQDNLNELGLHIEALLCFDKLDMIKEGD